MVFIHLCTEADCGPIYYRDKIAGIDQGHAAQVRLSEKRARGSF
jgi:hypothetical protein